MNTKNNHKNLVLEWLEIAREDVLAAKILAKNGVLRGALYHGQQAAEKYFKAYLVSKGIFPPKTHDLVTLMHDCCDWNRDLFKLSKSTARLNAYSTKTRYPDNAFVPTDEDVTLCLIAVDEVSCTFEKLLEA